MNVLLSPYLDPGFPPSRLKPAETCVEALLIDSIVREVRAGLVVLGLRGREEVSDKGRRRYGKCLTNLARFVHVVYKLVNLHPAQNARWA